ncbi:PKD domain-containing protein [Echinicola sp. 20G]|uniref:PKD domain-containing protein n=1 Tax=Echinicola sp. 20G TaxID=2781961 RepID=UPI0019103C26|nr:PKD domain-containing protein [Echinicola sp. 20G]
MRLYKSIALCLMMFFCLTSVQAQLTTVGKEFWFGFMENNTNGQNGTAVIVISANEPAQGTIDLSNFQGGLTYNFNLQTGQNYTLRIPESQQDLLHRNSGRIENKGVHVIANGKISVYAFNERLRSADGTVVLPVSTLGKDYYVASHYENSPSGNVGVNLNENDESLMLVVGVEDNTTVEITPSQRTIDGKTANAPFQIALNAGQSYQLKSKSDLTGSRVRVIGSNADDCKNIAVFGGNKWTGVGECGSANDHLFQQMYPINTWGLEFIHIPLKDRSSGELVKIIAAEDDTQISFDGVNVATLDQGEFRSFNFGPGDIKFINGNKPILVTVYSKSQACNIGSALHSNLGDPFMISYSPNEQLLKSITFQAMNVVQIQYSYVNIIVATSSVDKTILDGNIVANEFDPVPSNPTYSYARININSGSHKLENSDGFIAYVYGFGEIESYGYSVGASLENLNFLVEPTYEFEINGENVACLDQESLWSIEPENPIFTYFTWDFGDGSPIKVGQEVDHTFETPGNYTVKVVASISENSCEQQEDIAFEVDVLETIGELDGPSMVCPDVEEVTYKLVNTENIARAEWEVFGGTITNTTDSTATVLWGETSDNAFIAASPFTEEGCPGEIIRTDVIINQSIEPLAPEGETSICFDANQIHMYVASEIVPNRTYQWYIQGGQIVSDNDHSEVEVVWDTPDLSGQIWYEEFSQLDAMCSGVSEVLNVMVHQALVSNFEVTDVLCYGDNSGEIQLNVEGGVSPYQFEWSHDASLNQNLAINLAAGNYSVIVTDSEGCQVSHESIIINQPEDLLANVTSISGTSCYGKADGKVSISVTGGVGPYQIDHENASIQGGTINLSEVAGGELVFTLTDANGCGIPVLATVPSPEPLLVDVEVVTRSCPGEANGELLAVPKGGNGPFTFTWDYEQSQGATLSGIPKGVYAVEVLDNNGCISLGSSELEEEAPVVRLPTGFNLNEEGVNSLFQPISNCSLDYHLSIYNRWGELIFTAKEPWDGKIDGNVVADGSYTYLLEYNFVLEGESQTVQKRGVFTVLR